MKEPSNLESTPLYSSRMVDNYIRLIKSDYSYVNVDELLKHAGMTPYEIADEGHWFTGAQMDRFHEKVYESTKDEEIFRKAGRYAASPEAGSVLQQYFRGTISTAASYALLESSIEKITRADKIHTRKINSNKVEVTAKLRKGVVQGRSYCENRMGYLEAIALMCKRKQPRIVHDDCMFKGGESCRYIITWKKTALNIIKKIVHISALILFSSCLVFSFFDFQLVVSVLFPGSTAIILLLTMIVWRKEKEEMKSRIRDLRISTSQLVDQININYNNSMLTNEMGQLVGRQAKIDSTLDNIVHISKRWLDYDRCMLLLADPERKELKFHAGYGYTDDQLNLFKRTAFQLKRSRRYKKVLATAFHEQQPVLINDISQIEKKLSKESLTLTSRLKTQSFLCCPIIYDGVSIGVLAVDNLKTKRPLVQSDMNLLMGIASITGISIRSTDLYEARERQFRSILKVMAASIDARDPMTSGHSERVTEYASGISREMGFPEDFCEMIQVAALLHDYGKIGVPDAILKKPGGLTKKEYEIVKTHSEKTKNILEQINFEGIFSQIPSITGSHHEKIDGSGYPAGLKGEEIPLGARILAVADFFEAITAKRHYRGPMQINKALKMLKDDTGKHFDKNVVDAFFMYYTGINSNKLKLPKKLKIPVDQKYVM